MPTIMAYNVETAIALLDDLIEDLETLSAIRSLPTRVLTRVMRASNLAHSAQSHLITADSISEDRLLGDAKDQRTGRSQAGHRVRSR